MNVSNVWPNQGVESARQTLANLKGLLDEAVRDGAASVGPELARFLVVRSCGYLEQVAITCCRCYVLRHSNAQAGSFAESWIQRTRGSIPEMLVDLVGRLDEAWRQELELFLREDDEYRWIELKFLVDRRHRIAHGLNESVRPRKATELYEVSTEVANWFIGSSELAS